MDTLHSIEALIFDVFGTVVDWRGGVKEQLETQLTEDLGWLDCRMLPLLLN
jgi:hypothetical protein